MWKFAILAAVAAATAPHATVVAASKWHIEDQLSQLDEPQTMMADLDSTNKLPDDVGSLEAATLFVQCERGALSVYVVWPPFMGGDDRDMQWKFDDGPVTKQSWMGSVLGTTTYDPTPYDFLAGLAAAKRFAIDASLPKQDDTKAMFDTTGADKIVAAALDACPKPSRPDH